MSHYFVLGKTKNPREIIWMFVYNMLENHQQVADEVSTSTELRLLEMDSQECVPQIILYVVEEN
jgi:hypothetical protein